QARTVPRAVPAREIRKSDQALVWYAGEMHPRLNSLGVSHEVLRITPLEPPGIWQHYRYPHRLGAVKTGRRDPVVMAGCSLGTVDTIPPLHHIQIHLQDAPFIPQQLHHAGDNGFLELPEITAPGGEEQIFCELLGDGRTAC